MPNTASKIIMLVKNKTSQASAYTTLNDLSTRFTTWNETKVRLDGRNFKKNKKLIWRLFCLGKDDNKSILCIQSAILTLCQLNQPVIFIMSSFRQGLSVISDSQLTLKSDIIGILAGFNWTIGDHKMTQLFGSKKNWRGIQFQQEINLRS